MKEGHREEYAQLAERLRAMSSDEKANLLTERSRRGESVYRLRFILANDDAIGKRGLLGWDLARLISVCRGGYVAGYLTEDEAWQSIMGAARRLQGRFESWEDLGMNYLLGREYWSEKQRPTTLQAMRETYRKLLTDPQSPWKLCPWNLNLDEISAPKPAQRPVPSRPPRRGPAPPR